jgi:hypothetical protein
LYTGGQSRLQGRAASFCLERSGYNEGGLNDQGLVFFLPNMTFLQPPGLVHKMIANTWQAIAAEVALVGQGCGSAFPFRGPDFGGSPYREPKGAVVSAQVSADGSAKSIRFVNRGDTPIALTVVDIDNTQMAGGGGAWNVSTITGAPNATNTPSDPQAIAPTTTRPLRAGEAFVAPPNSFTVFTLSTSRLKTDEHAMLKANQRAERQPPQRPHILFALIDDYGWSDAGWHRDPDYLDIQVCLSLPSSNLPVALAFSSSDHSMSSADARHGLAGRDGNRARSPLHV